MIISFPSQSQNHPIDKPNQSPIDNSNIELIYPMSPHNNENLLEKAEKLESHESNGQELEDP